jgi:hypothetical protein
MQPKKKNCYCSDLQIFFFVLGDNFCVRSFDKKKIGEKNWKFSQFIRVKKN